MMSLCMARALGAGALELMLGKRRILVDAVNSVTRAVEPKDGDLLLFTHDDEDHFSAATFPSIKNKEITVIGPPSIVKPLLEHGVARLNQIEVLYACSNKRPPSFAWGDIRITSYATPHFMDWKPIHNSYLVKSGDRKIFITGDSFFSPDITGLADGLDTVVCNLVEEGYITKKDDPKYAVHHHLSYMLRVMSQCSPKKIVGIHLIDFDGTVDAMEMKKLAEDFRFDFILIPVSTDEVIAL